MPAKAKGSLVNEQVIKMFSCLMLTVAATCGSWEPASVEASKAQGEVFQLEQVSSYEHVANLRGQMERCSREPDEAVKTYPEVQSATPFYGTLNFQLKSAFDKESGVKFRFLVDESQGSATGYDRLYFDRNGDLDLTNDEPLRPLKEPPWSGKFDVYFEEFALNVDYGDSGVKPFRVLPTLLLWKGGYAAVCFVSPIAFKGKLRLGESEHDVILCQNYILTGRFDNSWVSMQLTPKIYTDFSANWTGAMLEVNGTLYELAANPLGDTLRVAPYQGDWGYLEVGQGQRRLDDNQLSVSGWLGSETLSVALGRWEDSDQVPQRRTRIPVGDYLANYVNVRFGPLAIAISMNYHSDGKIQDRGGRPSVRGFQVRKDNPYVLDFSNEPEVMFASPGKDQCFKRGDKIEVKGILIDPVHDMMIRRLSREQGDKSESLDPKVKIASSSGRIITRGNMPFG